MAERNLYERLDEAIDAIFEGRTGGLALADPELATLLVAASDLRELPDPRFKARLKADLVPQTTKETTTVKPGFHTVTPYLLVRPAAEMIEFLKTVFNAEEKFRVPDESSGLIMHAQLQIGDSPFELSDGSPEYPAMPTTFHVYIDDAEAAYRRAIAAGATSLGEPGERPYGDYEGGVRDPFGNDWWIATHVEDVEEEEVMRRFQTPKPLTPTPGAGPAPKGYWTVNTSSRVHGAAKLIEFLRAAFDAEVRSLTPGPENTVRHADVRIGDSAYEVGDVSGEWGLMNSAVHLLVDDVDATWQRAVAAGAKTLREPIDAPYGERNAAIVDPFGNHWYIAKPL